MKMPLLTRIDGKTWNIPINIRRWRRIVHKILGWHYVISIEGFDGINMKGICEICEKRCLQDSQGNWF